MHTHLSDVAFHVHCVGLGCHVVIGVGRLVARFHHALIIPSFLHVVVRLYLVIVNSNCSHNCCLLHIAKTGHLRCCLYTIFSRIPGFQLVLSFHLFDPDELLCAPAVQQRTPPPEKYCEINSKTTRIRNRNHQPIPAGRKFAFAT